MRKISDYFPLQESGQSHDSIGINMIQ
jgi:hypothetical protein